MKAMVIGLVLILGASNVFAHSKFTRAKLYDQTGLEVGTIAFNQKNSGVLVNVRVQNLPPGFHGFHIHSVGVCVSPFTTAGGHFNLLGRNHPEHSGDFPVLLVNANGAGKAEFVTDRFSVSDLFDADGSAVIVHGNPDNYANIPTARYAPPPDATTLATGDAGARIACGVIKN
jgi:superoxide dismutase, Cu-Zn family